MKFYGVDFKTLWTFIDRMPKVSKHLDILHFTQYQDFTTEQIEQIFWYLGHPFYKARMPLKDLPETEILIYAEINNHYQRLKRIREQQQAQAQLQQALWDKVREISGGKLE